MVTIFLLFVVICHLMIECQGFLIIEKIRLAITKTQNQVQTKGALTPIGFLTNGWTEHLFTSLDGNQLHQQTIVHNLPARISRTVHPSVSSHPSRIPLHLTTLYQKCGGRKKWSNPSWWSISAENLNVRFRGALYTDTLSSERKENRRRLPRYKEPFTRAFGAPAPAPCLWM